MRPHGLHTFGGPPARDLAYYFKAASFSLSGGGLVLAFARWNDLPANARG